MATAISRTVSMMSRAVGSIVMVGAMFIVACEAAEIRCNKRCPDVMLAVSRIPRARGRIIRLINSMATRIGIRGVGVPVGRRCASTSFGFLAMPVSTVPSHIGNARAKFTDRWEVGVKVYGSRPIMLSVVSRKNMDTSTMAQFCPAGGIIDVKCCAAFLYAHFIKAVVRSVYSRFDVSGDSSIGNSIVISAMLIPSARGRVNWSNRFAIISL